MRSIGLVVCKACFVALTLILPAKGFSKEFARAILMHKIAKIIDTTHGKVGVAMIGLDFTDTLTINGTGHYPMQSVFKFPLAMYILHLVDNGELSLSQKIHIRKEEIDTATWSPMARENGRQDINMSLKDVLAYAVSKSDNNCCDVLFRLAGGTKPVNAYIHNLGIHGIAIMATEAGMKKGWAVQYTNWCQPTAMADLLQLFFKGGVLSKSGSEALMTMMLKSENSPNRLLGLLPDIAVVAHKTGTSNRNETGMIAATNDVGIVTLPNGLHYAIVVYVSDYMGGYEHGEHVIAAISKAVWDYCRVTAGMAISKNKE